MVRLLDYAFTLEPPIQSGRHTIRVENAGVEPHDLVLMKLAPGISADDVEIALNPERARRVRADLHGDGARWSVAYRARDDPAGERSIVKENSVPGGLVAS